MAAYSIHIRYTFFPLGRSTSKSHPCVYGGKAYCGDFAGNHPRACGEKSLAVSRKLVSVGSPPRMRGKGDDRRIVLVRMGITPAHAGKSYRLLRAGRVEQDHPRACGEKTAHLQKTATETGSPPRMRGKAMATNTYNSKVRITPAHAGKRSLRGCSCPVSGDHPRACGEKGTASPVV